MPSMESMQIGRSLFVFINGLPVGWFINNKPIFFSPQSSLESSKERGGVSAVLSWKDIPLLNSVLIPLGGMAGQQARKHVCSMIYHEKGSKAGKVSRCKLTAKGKVLLPLEGCSKKDYPWIVKYQIQTILEEDFIQVGIIIKRFDKNKSVDKPLINLSLYPYFAIGSGGFVTSVDGNAFIFARELIPNFIDVVDCQIETAGAKIRMSIDGAEGFYLHSNNFNEQGCIQSVFAKPRGFGGSEDKELSVGEELQVTMTLKKMND